LRIKSKQQKLKWKFVCNVCKSKWELFYTAPPFEAIDAYGDLIDDLAKKGEIPEWGLGKHKDAGEKYLRIGD